MVIVAGCGIDNCGTQDSQHDGIHRFYVGPGAKGPRVPWAHTLTAEEAAGYTFEKVMYQAEDGIRWNPYDNR